MTEPAVQTLLLLTMLTLKHLVADFVLQSRYIIQNRWIYGHPAGLLHVAIHLGLTLPVLLVMGTPMPVIATMLAAEGAVHYHIDWAKDNTVRRYQLTPARRAYWVVFGIDQTLHQLTYVAMAAWWSAVS